MLGAPPPCVPLHDGKLDPIVARMPLGAHYFDPPNFVIHYSPSVGATSQSSIAIVTQVPRFKVVIYLVQPHMVRIVHHLFRLIGLPCVANHNLMDDVRKEAAVSRFVKGCVGWGNEAFTGDSGGHSESMDAEASFLLCCVYSLGGGGAGQLG